MPNGGSTVADSPLINLMRQFKEALLAAETDKVQAMTTRWLQLETRIEATIAALAEEMARRQANNEPVTQAALFQLRRYQLLLTQIESELTLYQQFAATEIGDGQRDMAELSIRQSAATVNAAVRGASVSFTRLPVGAVENMVGALGNGSPLQSLLLNAATKAALVDDLTSTLIEATALGRNPRKTARAMQDSLAGGLNQALKIARTEQLRVYREVSRRQYQLSGVVEGYYRLATRDTRTCPACLADDGQFYPLDRVMPVHPQCRCTMIPAVTGKPSWVKGHEWFETLAESNQRKILGNARYEAWRDGRFKFSDLAVVQRNAVWSDSLQAAPLKDLVN